MKWCTLPMITLIIYAFLESRHQILLWLCMLMMMTQWRGWGGRWLWLMLPSSSRGEIAIEYLVLHRLLKDRRDHTSCLESSLDMMVWLWWYLRAMQGRGLLLVEAHLKWRLTKNWITTLSVNLLLLLCRVCISPLSKIMWMLWGSISGDRRSCCCCRLRNLLIS